MNPIARVQVLRAARQSIEPRQIGLSVHVAEGEGQEHVRWITVLGDCGGVHGEESMGVDVVKPHRCRIPVENDLLAVVAR
jgi:hypothetical protein